MRYVKKDFKNPPEELKAVSQKYKSMFCDGKENKVIKSNCYKKAKKALEKLYHGKCAYCETSIGAGFYMRIDHYRPKSIYRWLVFEWSNLVSSCEICNTKKGNQFPLPKGIPMVTRGEPESEESLANSKTLLAERPLLLHPELDYPEQHLEFRNDGNLKEKNNSAKGKTTIRVCDLNRDILRRERKSQIDGILYSVQNITLSIINILEEFPQLCHNDKAILSLLSFYYETFDKLQKMKNPENVHVFSFLGLQMYEKFEYFIISGLTDNKDIRTIAGNAFRFFKEGKLDALRHSTMV